MSENKRISSKEFSHNRDDLVLQIRWLLVEMSYAMACIDSGALGEACKTLNEEVNESKWMNVKSKEKPSLNELTKIKIIEDISVRINAIEDSRRIHLLKKNFDFANQLWSRREELKSLKSRIEKGNLFEAVLGEYFKESEVK